MDYYEELSLELFRIEYGVDQLIRKNMVKTVKELLYKRERMEADGLDSIETLESLTRTPDAIALFTTEQALCAGFPFEMPAIVFCEAEHTSPLTPKALIEYSDLYDEIMDFYDYQVAVAIIERYGRTQFLNLSAVYHANIRYEMKKRGMKEFGE